VTSPHGGRKTDTLDEQILWILMGDGRASVTNIASELGVSKSTVSTRLLGLKKSGVLESVHADIDYAALGLAIQAVVFVRLRVHARGQAADFAHTVIRLPNVHSVLHLTGIDDFILQIACTSPQHLREIVESQVSVHPAVAATRSEVIFESANGKNLTSALRGWDDVRQGASYQSYFD